MPKRCKESFVVMLGGVPRVLSAGQIVADDDPAVKGREGAFESIDTAAARSTRTVEQATAAPGEQRMVTRPAKKAAPRPKSE